MSWKRSIDSLIHWIISDAVLFLVLCNVVVAAPRGKPFAPEVDPFAPINPPPPPTYNPQYIPQQQPPQQQYMNQQPPPPQQQYMNQPPPPSPNNVFAMPNQPSQPQQQPMNMNYKAQPQYMQPRYPVISQLPPRDAAPVGATAPPSSNGEMEFESGQGGGGGWGGGATSNYVYPPTYPQNSYAAGPQPGQFSPPSLLDAYYHTPYHQGQNYYQYQMQQRNRNDMFGGMFGSTPSGNMFGALMLNEFVF